MEIDAAIRRELLSDPTVAGYVGNKVYRRSLWDNLEVLQGARAIVVKRGTGWATPQRKNTQEYPTVLLECWADGDRDAEGNLITDNGIDNAFALYRAADAVLHMKPEGIWGKFGTSSGLEVIGCSRAAEPMPFGPKDVSPDLRAQMDTFRYVQVPYDLQVVHGTLSPFPNLLTGDTADFEGGTIGTWTNWYGFTTANTTEQAQSGTHSLKVVADGGIWGGYWGTQAYVPVTAGKVYEASAAIRAATVARSLTLGIQWYNADYWWIGQDYAGGDVTGSVITDQVGAWTTLSGSTELPLDAAFADIFFILNDVPPAGEALYLDDASFRQA